MAETSKRTLSSYVWLMVLLTLDKALPGSGVTEYKVGVVAIHALWLPYGERRTGPAMDMAFDAVNKHLMNNSYKITPVVRTYGPYCDASVAPGRQKQYY